LTFTNLSWQKGSAAQVVSFIREFRRIHGPTRFILLSQYCDLDNLLAKTCNVDVVGYPFTPGISPTLQNCRWLWQVVLTVIFYGLGKIRIKTAFLERNAIASALIQTDMVADLSGDSYRDRPGGFSLAHNIFLISMMLLSKPIVLVSQSLGPFRWYNRILTSMVLKKLNFIYVREKRSLALIEGLGVKSDNILLAPDIAFMLSVPDEWKPRRSWQDAGVSERYPNHGVVGISVSCLMMELPDKGARYLDAIVAAASHAHEKYGARILLVPHVVNRPELGADDRGACKHVFDILGRPDWVMIVDGDCGPGELKGIISGCDLFVASRMHAGIAALSSSIPTIFLAWSHKYRGLLEEIGLEKYVWELEREHPSILPALLDDLWLNRIETRRILDAYRLLASQQITKTLKSIVTCLQARDAICEENPVAGIS